MSGGVFAVSRGIFEHEFFEDEPFTEREAWIWLIREAAWKPRKVRSPTGPITIQRGQCSCSVRFLADRWKWSKSRVGRFLRRSKLDEIPQFWNVFRGDMSMVGPRAHVLDEVERYRSRYRRMFSIKPGIFGLSQIAQVSWPDLTFEEEIKLNTFYIENWSLWLDIKILAKSFWLLFFAKKPKEDY